MKKLKNILIVLCSVCALAATVCLCAACEETVPQVEYPDYRESSTTITPDDEDGDTFSGRYEFTVTSEGGLSMGGVRISLLNATQQEVAVGISSNGVVVLTTTPGVYTVKVDEASLPDGYIVPEDTIVTSATEGKVSIILATKIPTDTKNGTYSQGDVMHNFSLTDSETNEELNLINLLEGENAYKAVVLNFFYVGCSPCRSELPAMQQAYVQYQNDVKIIALSPYDSASQISAFKQGLPPVSLSTRVTFNMCVDPDGYMTDLFDVSSFPTTVVIDRYGVIAYIESGSMTQPSAWTSMFAYYTSASYAQTGSTGDENPDDPDSPSDVRDIPNVTQPTSAEIAAAVAPEMAADAINATFHPEEDEEDALYSWPFLTGSIANETFIYPANSARKDDGSKIHNSYAIIYADVIMEVGDILSFEYWTETEDGFDYLYFLVDRDIVGRYTGDSAGWQESGNMFFATRAGTFEIAFVYMKDDGEPDNDATDDIVRIRNIRQINAQEVVEATDVLTAAVSGDERTSETIYQAVTAPADSMRGYYTVDSNDNSLLYVDILHYTTWSLFEGFERSSNNLGISSASVYSIILSSYSSSDNTRYTVNGVDHTSTVVDLYYMQLFSETGYVPVNGAVKALLDDFLKQYCGDNNKTYNENMWLEFCYYFIHYGEDHAEGAHCFETYDPVEGTHWYNAPTVDVSGLYDLNSNIVVTKDDDAYTVKHTATILSPTQINAGTRYLFTPQTSGVYLIKTNLTNSEDGMGPAVGIFDANEEHNLFSTYAPLNYDYFGMGNYDSDGDGLYDNVSRYNGQVWVYYYFEAETTYCLRLGFFTAGTTGSYEFGLQYLGESYRVLFHASGLGDGTWTDNFKYTSVTAILDPSDSIWYHDNGTDGTADSMIYVDFLRGTYFDSSRARSLKSIIDNGGFNLTSLGGANYTSQMRTYYNRSIEGKETTDPEYGLYQASESLINILKLFITARLGSDYVGTAAQDSFFWLSTCCYYQEFSATSNYSTSYLGID